MFLDNLYTYFQNKSTNKNITIGVIIILLFNFMLIPIITKLLNDNGNFISNILDVHFSYTKELVNTSLYNLGENGRSFYIIFALFFDLPYAIIYGFIYSIIIIKLFEGVKNIFVKYLFILPFTISIFDILENFGIVIMLANYPNINNFLINLNSVFTSIKWSFAVIVGITIILGIGVKMKTLIIKKHI